MKSLYRQIIIDFTILAIIGILTALISKDVFGIRKRGFFKNDVLSIGFPHLGTETVPMGLATVWVLGGPIIVLLFFWFFVDKLHQSTFDNQTSEIDYVDHNDYNDNNIAFPIYNTQFRNHNHNNNNNTDNDSSLDAVSSSTAIQPQEQPTIINKRNSPLSSPSQQSQQSQQHQQQQQHHQQQQQDKSLDILVSNVQYRINWGNAIIPNQTPFQRKLRFIIYQAYVMMFVILLSLFITNCIKNIVGSLRPDYIQTCNPNWEHPDLKIDPITSWIDFKYEAIICRGTPKALLEGHKSFPSGHASSTMASSVFIAIYLYKRFWNRGKRYYGSTFIPFLMTLSILVSLCIAATRHIDYRHRFADLIIGLIIGTLSAFVSLPLQPFIPSYEFDGTIKSTQQLLQRDQNYYQQQTY